MKLNLLFIILLFILGCNKSGEQKTKKNNSFWTKDSLGCMNKRNMDLAEEMISQNNLENCSISEFKNIFGRSNETKYDGSIVTFIYYWGSACHNNSIQKNSDKCYAKFVFDRGKLIDRSYPCE
ncbi:hypothetical protein NZD88_15170 [Chryseobacterium antibioticum]|uniref:Lipoprotein n=1 Tax=Chryseobacterium pyrolae TaxID=2987481 RepID=A0ABT2IJQ9_9FLAO|nr:hypothetical protein [Chryseobacterium pyrolae]MCT2408885.1 hypothetical protein [Chryseobacterium pyrolae]